MAEEKYTGIYADCGRDNVLYTGGPIDPEVGLLQATGQNGNLVAMLLHFRSPLAFGYPKRYVSPYWCGCRVNEMLGFAA